MVIVGNKNDRTGHKMSQTEQMSTLVRAMSVFHMLKRHTHLPAQCHLCSSQIVLTRKEAEETMAKQGIVDDGIKPMMLLGITCIGKPKGQCEHDHLPWAFGN